MFYLRKHLTPSTAIAFIALVFAVTGGAYAATGGGSGSPSHATALASAAKAKSKSKAKTGPRGPAGPKGATGATGATGLAGPQGPGGAAGAKGENGAAGTPGAPGEPGAPGKNGSNGSSVSTKEFTGANGGSCKEGGNELKAGAATTYVCNGKEGSPWTDGGTLPAGKTETGQWSTLGLSPVGGRMFPAISFPIPLSGGFGTADKTINIHFIGVEEEPPAGCTGGTDQAPTAEPGNLCIYAVEMKEVTVDFSSNLPGAPEMMIPEYNIGAWAGRVGTTGGFMVLDSEGPNTEAAGTWAVTETEA